MEGPCGHSCVCAENKWEDRVEPRTLIKEVAVVGQARDQGRGSGNERRWNYLEKGKMQDLTIDWLGRRLPL